jgi:hypothetical protein
VRVAPARWTVTTRLIRTSVRPVHSGDALVIVEPATGQMVAEHDLAAPGTRRCTTSATLDPDRLRTEHLGRERLLSSNSVRSVRAPKRSWSVPPRSPITRLGSELEVLLVLGATHGTEALVAASTRVVEFRRFRAADVRSILAVGAGRSCRCVSARGSPDVTGIELLDDSFNCPAGGAQNSAAPRFDPTSRWRK